MRNPHRWRNIALAFFPSGIIATPAPFLLPEAAAGDTARGLLFIYGVMALLFGGGSALFRRHPRCCGPALTLATRASEEERDRQAPQKGGLLRRRACCRGGPDGLGAIVLIP
jgi:hypothetical protein